MINLDHIPVEQRSSYISSGTIRIDDLEGKKGGDVKIIGKSGFTPGGLNISPINIPG